MVLVETLFLILLELEQDQLPQLVEEAVAAVQVLGYLVALGVAVEQIPLLEVAQHKVTLVEELATGMPVEQDIHLEQMIRVAVQVVLVL